MRPHAPVSDNGRDSTVPLYAREAVSRVWSHGWYHSGSCKWPPENCASHAARRHTTRLGNELSRGGLMSYRCGSVAAPPNTDDSNVHPHTVTPPRRTPAGVWQESTS